MRPEQEREFLVRLAAIWLGCRLAVMGGTPGIKAHRPVRCMHTLGWAMLGCVDYAAEMRLMLAEVRNGRAHCVEDRATGQVFYCPPQDAAIGAILAVNWRCPHGADVHVFPMRLKVARETPMCEVRTMAEKNALGIQFRLARRRWYEVQVD